MPFLAVAPSFEQADPLRADVGLTPAVGAAVVLGDVVGTVVDVATAAHEAHEIPAVFTAIPGLSACEPKPND